MRRPQRSTTQGAPALTAACAHRCVPCAVRGWERAPPTIPGAPAVSYRPGVADSCSSFLLLSIPTLIPFSLQGHRASPGALFPSMVTFETFSLSPPPTAHLSLAPPTHTYELQHKTLITLTSCSLCHCGPRHNKPAITSRLSSAR